MCKCIEETESQFREALSDGKAAQTIPVKGAVLKSFTALNVAFMLRGGVCRLYIPFEAVWDLPPGKKQKTKTTKINMLASHCPFCGKPVEEESKP